MPIYGLVSVRCDTSIVNLEFFAGTGQQSRLLNDMALSLELRDFCDSWRAKAAACSLENIHGAFERFFTSYVAFNRLYTEATFRLAQQGHVKLRERFPDSLAAQDYVVQFCTAATLTQAWENSANATAALHEIADHLREGRFSPKLDPVTGDRRPAKDLELLTALESNGRNRKAKAVLEALYALRCNMFHGQKDFHLRQLALLRPAILLLEVTTDVLYHAL